MASDIPPLIQLKLATVNYVDGLPPMHLAHNRFGSQDARYWLNELIEHSTDPMLEIARALYAIGGPQGKGPPKRIIFDFSHISPQPEPVVQVEWNDDGNK